MSTTSRARAGWLTDYGNPYSLGSRLRARRIGPMVKLIEQAYRQHGAALILDVGGRRRYWDILPPGLLDRCRVQITILNLPSDLRGRDDRHFMHLAGDACDLGGQIADRAFHIAHSNSVIEHVGGWWKIKAFAAEVRRVADCLYVQTPYYWFPMEPHYLIPFFHWLPRPAQVRLVRSLALNHRAKAKDLEEAQQQVEGAPRLLDVKTFRLLFPDCEIRRERFLGLTKSMIALRGLEE